MMKLVFPQLVSGQIRIRTHDSLSLTSTLHMMRLPNTALQFFGMQMFPHCVFVIEGCVEGENKCPGQSASL